MAIITINGVEITEITAYKVSPADLDSENTSRNGKGKMQRERIRAGVVSLSVSCYLTGAQLASIATQTTDSAFSVTYLHPEKNTMITSTFYCGSPSYEMVFGNSVESLWRASYDFVEF